MSWHIIPVHDLHEHEDSTSCHCNPKIQVEDGEIFVVHNSYDGREFKEQLLDKIKDQFQYDNKIDVTFI